MANLTNKQLIEKYVEYITLSDDERKKRAMTSKLPAIWGNDRNVNGSLSYEGVCLKSYNTVIAIYVKNNNLMCINGAKYSVTTSRHVNLLQSIIKNTNIKTQIIYNASSDFVYCALKTFKK